MTTETEKPKRKLKPGMGKSKGNGFESTIAKTLSKNLQPLNFIRTPGSGARVGGKNFATIGAMFGEEALKIFVGDVVPVNEKQENVIFLHSVECKFYKSQDTFTGLASGSANIFKWFAESEEDAKKIGKNPMLIFKWNHTATFVAVDNRAWAPKLAKPQFSIITYSPDASKTLDIYLLEELLKTPDFWYKKNDT